MSPSNGAEKKGPTAVLRSLARIMEVTAGSSPEGEPAEYLVFEVQS